MEDDLVLDCPDCEEPTDHEVVRAAAAAWTVQCVECGRVRTLPSPKMPKPVLVPVILAEGATSRKTVLELGTGDVVHNDDEFQLEGHRVLVTALELRDGQRPAKSKAEDLHQVYAVIFDTVTLHYTVNEGETTRSFQEPVSPEEEVHIGTIRDVAGLKLAIKTLKSDQNRTLHRGFLLARNVNRVFADVAAKKKARHGDKVKTRNRGAGPWGSKGESNKDRKPRGTGSGPGRGRSPGRSGGASKPRSGGNKAGSGRGRPRSGR